MPGNFAWIFVSLCFVFGIWMLIDCINNKELQTFYKVIWALILLLAFYLGRQQFLYLFIGVSAYGTFRIRQMRKRSQNQLSQTPQSQDSQADQPYSQGYQAQQTPSSPSGIQPIPPAQSIYEQYEQPRAVYPEQSQQDTY